MVHLSFSIKNSNVDPQRRFFPVILMIVPPDLIPLRGSIESTCGVLYYSSKKNVKSKKKKRIKSNTHHVFVNKLVALVER